jgi:hypothetical protein
MEPLTRHNSNGWLTALPLNITVGWICLTFSNTLAYYDAAKITAVRSFIVQAPGLRKTKKERKYRRERQKETTKTCGGDTTEKYRS